MARAKTSLVARGFKLRKGIDSFETLAPTPAAPCFRLLAGIAFELGLGLCQFDAEQAFIQANLDQDVSVRLRQGCG